MPSMLKALLALSSDKTRFAACAKIIEGMTKEDVSSTIGFCVAGHVSDIPEDILQSVLCIFLSNIAKSVRVDGSPSSTGEYKVWYI